MDQESEKPEPCTTCGAAVKELRRGRCWTCYTRWSEQRPVGLGACCSVCDERRRENLRLVEVQGRSLPMCHLCAARVAKLDVVPHSVEGLRAAMRRDRRAVDRRAGVVSDDRGDGAERRAAERRLSLSDRPVGAAGAVGDDEGFYLLDEIDLELDVGEDDIVETTVVADSPDRARDAALADA